MFDRRLVENFDWGLLGIIIALLSIGLFTLYSAVGSGGPISEHPLCLRQIVWYGFGGTIMIACFFLNYKLLDRWGGSLYIGCIILLICVLFFGKFVAGSRRWLELGFFSIQPSELVKIGVIVALARYYSRHANTKGLSISDLLIPFLYVAVPFFLIAKQPDLGTGLLLVLIAASMTIFVKIERRSLIYLMFVAIGALALLAFFLKPYQKERILTFLNPDRDPLGAGYHIIQSKIAIGSGMLSGKGFLKGTQKALSFLPEQHTDFILPVLAEEWGFVGSSFVLFVYLLLIVWGLNIAHECRDSFGVIMAVGIVAMIFWQVFINTGMVMGLMPVVGVPLPLISYGGSSVITTMIGLGILLSISMRRFMLNKTQV